MKKNYFLFIFLLAINLCSMAQGWEHRYSSSQYIKNVIKDESGFVHLGERNIGDPFILFKTNSQGDSIWSKIVNLGKTAVSQLIKTKEGGYVIAASLYPPFTSEIDMYLVKLNAAGDTMWTKSFGVPGYDYGISVAETENSDLVFVGNMPAPGGIRFIKTDKNGKLLVEKTWGGGNTITAARGIKVLPDGSYIVQGDNGGSLDGIYLAKLDQGGNILWDKSLEFGNGISTWAENINLCNDGGFIIGGSSNQTGTIFRLDSSGNLLWSKSFHPGSSCQIYSVIQSSDLGFVFTGSLFEFHGPDSTESLYVVKTDPKGDTVWTKKSSFPPYYSNGYTIIETADLGYLIGGTSQFGMLLKLDINGNSYVNNISGNLYYDQNNNCQKDAGERPQINWLVKLMPGNSYATTDSLGNYSFRVNAGSYTITPVMKNQVWSQQCSNSSIDVNFNSSFQTSAGNDFAIAALDCPFLKVDVSTPILRRCFKNNTFIHYSNEGAKTVNNVQIVAQFPSAIIPLLSSKPYVQAGDIYTFNVGAIQPGDKGVITIIDSLDCKVALGSTHCVKATILPLNNCQAPDASWDRSSIKVDGVCEGDVVKFTLTNDGSGDMSGTSMFRVYFNNLLDSIGSFKLNSNETLTLLINSKGMTVRLEADQHPKHPGMSRPRATVEGCNSTDFGYVLNVPQDDEEDFVEIDCQTVIGSFDPNDKSVIPEGITKNNYIPTTSQLEYRIRFQNTGTDTAFTVVIKDAISNNLDISTFKMETASHPYTYKIISGETNVIEWRFDNIKLPDSNKNEPLSHGYVKYKISQKANLTPKSVIENTAAIYFDYNEPVFTNTTRSVVFDTVLTSPRITGLTSWTPTVQKVKVYPNPISDRAKIEIESNANNLNLYIFDAAGKLYKQITSVSTKNLEINKDDYPEGLYVYKVYSGDELLGTGKLVMIK